MYFNSMIPDLKRPTNNCKCWDILCYLFSETNISDLYLQINFPATVYFCLNLVLIVAEYIQFKK